MTQTELKQRLKQLKKRLRRGDIRAANEHAQATYGVGYKQPAGWSRLINGETESYYTFELYASLLHVVTQREKREKQILDRITA